MSHLAFRSASGNGVRFGNQSGQTATNRVAQLVGDTSGSRSTRGRVARIRFLDALLVVANVSGLTIRITDAFRSASGNGVRLGNKSRFAAEK